MQPSTVSRILTEQQLEAYTDDGYVVVRGMLSPAEVRELCSTFMEAGKDGPVEGLSEFKKGSGGSSGTYPDSDPLAKYPRMMHPHRHPELPVGPIATRYMLDTRVHDVVASLFGEEPVAAQSMFYFKPPGARGQDLHQDNFYLRVSPGSCVAAWCALDDADEGNGGMMLVPGTGQLDIACPTPADTTKFFTSDHVEPPAGKHPVQLDLRAGDVLFFNGSVIHGSYGNTSQDRFRRAFICHYVPASSSETAHWYRPLLRFDGTETFVPEATGGGPCGTVAVQTAPH